MLVSGGRYFGAVALIEFFGSWLGVGCSIGEWRRYRILEIHCFGAYDVVQLGTSYMYVDCQCLRVDCFPLGI